MPVRFLVGVDGSDGSRRAAEFAAERARREGAALMLAHIVHWSPFEALTPEMMATRHVDKEKEVAAATKNVLAPLVKALSGKDLTIETRVLHGHAAEAIAELADSGEYTQAFIGRRGHSKVAAILFGSVSGSLVQTCPIPLTVVP